MSSPPPPGRGLDLTYECYRAMKYKAGQKLKAWRDSRLEVRPSPIHGRGMFALEPIPADTIVMRWGGIIVTEEDIRAGRVRVTPGTSARLHDDLFLADPEGIENSPDYFVNHSCDPNLWLQDAITLMTRRDVSPGEELTIDYALWDSESEWHITKCACGAPLCRGRISGRDWQLPELQARYRGHFTPHVEEMIKRARESSGTKR